MDRHDARRTFAGLSMIALAWLAPAPGQAQTLEPRPDAATPTSIGPEAASLELRLDTPDSLGTVSAPSSRVAMPATLVPPGQSDLLEEAQQRRRQRWGRALMIASAPVLVSGAILASLGREGVCYEPQDELVGARRAGYSMLSIGVAMTFAGVGSYVSVPRDFRRDHGPVRRRPGWVRASPFVAGAVSAILTFALSAFAWVDCVNS